MTMPSQVRVQGPLADFKAGFCEELSGRGYTPLSVTAQLAGMAHLSRWLDARGWSAGDLTAQRVGQFVESRRRDGYSKLWSKRGLAPLLGYLRAAGEVPVAVVPAVTPVDVLLDFYRKYLFEERGLADRTVEEYLRSARCFPSTRETGDGLDLMTLSAQDVTKFVVSECGRRPAGAAKYLVTALRSLLRFLRVGGWTAQELASVVPAVAAWRGASLPRGLDRLQVTRLLDSCDRGNGVGRRDYAILVLLVRLGLRAGEVAALELGDIDWRCGELIVTGKGRREERLPVPVDVGGAIADYLVHRRPNAGQPTVFLRAFAPQGAMSANAIGCVVGRACDRAGVARIGAHGLRHTAATDMLRAGSPLAEVGHVLRHRSAMSTALYAKVDTAALAELALPWPGAQR